MNDFVKWLGKTLLQGVLWVFVLSITVNGRTLYHHAHGLLVDNALVRGADEQLADLWSKLTTTARATFSSHKDDERSF